MKKIILVAGSLLFGTIANAQDIAVKRCYGQTPSGSTIVLETDHGRLQSGAGILVTETTRPAGLRGYYRVSAAYSPNFAELAYDLGFRAGYSHGSIRLVRNAIEKGPIRLQNFIGNQVVETILSCNINDAATNAASSGKSLPLCRAHHRCCYDPNYDDEICRLLRK